MKIATTRATLKNVVIAYRQPNITAQQKAMLRLAFRWLKRAQAVEYDIMCRLQVLEGAAGIRPGTWSNKGKFGIQEAMGQFRGRPIDQSWFSTRDTGMYALLLQQARALLSKVPDSSAEDILHNALMGLALDGSETKRLLVEVGKFLKDKILSGEESPARVAAGLAGNLLKRKALNEVKRVRRQQQITGPTVQDDGENEIPDQSLGYDYENDLEMLYDLMAKGDSLSRKLISVVKDFIATRREDGKAKPALIYWIEQVASGRMPSYNELAKMFGATAQTAKLRWIDPALNALRQEVLSNAKLRWEIELRMDSGSAARVASLWLQKQRKQAA